MTILFLARPHRADGRARVPPRVAGTSLALLLLAGLLPISANAQPGPPILQAEPGLENVSLAPFVKFLEDESRELEIEDVSSGLAASRFLTPETLSFGYSDSAYWFRFELENRSEEDLELLLTVGYPTLDEVELFVPRPEGGYSSQVLGDARPFGERTLDLRQLVFPLDVPRGQAETYYLRVTSTHSVSVPLHLSAVGSYLAYVERDTLALGLVYGLILALAAYHAFLFASIRETTYLSYVAVALLVGLVLAWEDGLAYRLWPDQPHWQSRAIWLIAASGVLSVLQFARDYLRTREESPRVDGLFRLFLTSTAVFLPLSYLMDLSWVRALQVWFLAPPLLFVAVAGGLRLRAGFVPARLFLVAWSPLLLTAVALSVLTPRGAVGHPLMMTFLRLSIVAQLLLFAFALASRLKLMRTEIDDTHASHREDLEALRRVAEGGVRCDELGDLANETVLALERRFAPDAAGVWLWNDDRGTLECQASIGISTSDDASPAGSLKLAEKVHEGGEAWISSDVGADTGVPCHAVGAVVPLRWQEASIGFILVCPGAGMELGEAELRALTAIAGELTLGVHRIRAADGLKRSESYFEALASSLHDIVSEVDARGRVRPLNTRTWEEVAGFGPDEVSDTRREITHPDDLPRVVEALGKPFRGEGTGRVVYRALQADGRYHWYDATAELIPNTGRRPKALVVSRDVTESKETEDRYERLIRHSPLGVIVVDRNLQISQLNPAATELLAIDSPQSLIGRSLGNPTDNLSPELIQAMETCMAEEEVAVIEAPWRIGTDRELRLRVHFAPIPDASGAIIGCQILVEDITGEHELRDQLHQAQKLEAVARLAGGVAHDLNNYLTSILGFSEVLLRREPDGGNGPGSEKHPLKLIRDAAERSAGVTRQLLAFGREQVIQPRVFAIGPVVAGMEPLLDPMVGEEVELTIDPGDPDVRVRMDPSQLEQVVVNLVLNARDAMPGGGQIHISVTSGSDPDQVVLAVADTGEGIDPETEARIFDPFFTTKDVGKGTGLGLAVVRGVVEQSGAEIQVDSAPGQGATFSISLPRSHDAIDVEADQSPGEAGTGARVLVVDDDEGVRILIRSVLLELGHEVTLARSGAEALALAEAGAGSFDLLITDVVMPGMNGVELNRRLTDRSPGFRVLFVSGHSEREELVEIEQSGHRLLAKPFSPVQLTVAVERELGGF